MDPRLAALFVAVFVFAGPLLRARVRAQANQGSCDPVNLMACRQLLAELIDNRKLAIVSTKEQLIHECPELQNAMQCVDDFTFKCYRKEVQDKVNRLYSGIRDFLQGLCNEGDVQNEFLEHAPCMVTLQPEEHDKCSRSWFNATTNQYPSPDDSDVSLQFNPALCCPFQDMSVCMRQMYLEKCGAEAAAIADKLLMKMVGPIVRESCLNNDNEFQCSSAGGVPERSTSLLLAAVAALLSLASITRRT